MLAYHSVTLRIILAVICLISSPTSLYGQNREKQECASSVNHRNIAPIEIASGVFLRKSHHGQVFEQADLANIGFIVGDQCVAVIDTGGSPEEGRALHCAILEVTDKDICYVINTHVHPDHILGNQSFASANFNIIGHKNLPRAMSILGATYIQRLKEVAPELEAEIKLPVKSVETSMALDLGNRRLVLTAHSNAHTDNDLTVFDEDTGTLWTGDLLFSDHVPILGGSGSISGYIEATQKLKQHAATLFIPGHGPVTSDISVAADIQLQYLSELRAQVRDWIEDNGDIGPAVENIGSRHDNLPMFDLFHKRNVSYAYTELEWE